MLSIPQLIGKDERLGVNTNQVAKFRNNFIMLGVCYYPEHWPEQKWAEDAALMRKMGIEWVRIGEFAWSRIEPARADWQFDWLDRAIDILSNAGLKIVMCTPTATPPKWLVDERPEILAWDESEKPRRFGSRRHSDFTNPAWREESRRIVEYVAERYGQKNGVAAWQLDNEYGCHDTVLSYAPCCRWAFRRWLEKRYRTIKALNEAWGAAFWSQEYGSFGQIDPPNLTVTEANPTHRLDYWRFASEQVAVYNRIQTEIVREMSPGRPITHNFMGFFTLFDHTRVAADLDFASWDSYPLGFTDKAMPWLSDDERRIYARTGHPDVAAFHHDLYRGLSHNGDFWVMEQQPGPVNWAAHNPAPAPGMVRLWTHEALAHGAGVVSYFRWRQSSVAQEQCHTGLNRPDGSLDTGGEEVVEVGGEIGFLDFANQRPDIATVAILFDDECDAAIKIQPQGQSFDYLRLAFTFYEAARRFGLDVDFLRPGDDATEHDLLLIPSQVIMDDRTADALLERTKPTIVGPRTGSRTRNHAIPKNLAPGPLADKLGIKITRVESLPDAVTDSITIGNQSYPVRHWRERIEGDANVISNFDDGDVALTEQDGWYYCGFWPEIEILENLINQALGGNLEPLPEGLRLRKRGDMTIATYRGEGEIELPADLGEPLIGETTMRRGDVAIFQ